MDIEHLTENNSFIDVKEKESLINVLNKYDFKVIDIYKSRSAYKVSTSSGNICLKKMKHGEYKASNGNMLVEYLISNGFSNIARYYKTKNGHLYVKSGKMIYYVTEWIDGIESDMNNIDEAIQCVKMLAQFHIASKKIDTSKFKIKNNLKNWSKIFKNDIDDLQRFKKIILRKRNKDDLDLSYLKHIDSFSNRGLAALSFLNESKYAKLSMKAYEDKTICHDSFYYQNIIKKNNTFYIVDLDSIIIDLQINDLGKLIRRLMFRKAYRWDFNKAKLLIESYTSINLLSKDELEAMLSLIIFPHKFWKLGKKRYVKDKSWNQTKYIHKLNRIIECDVLQQKFLEDYLDYLRNI